jgi:predicted AlkP superfamily phosphohydrolase/phosphomutase/tetratricopeptide (TPR) repeat protein
MSLHNGKKKVVVIGWDAADWEFISPLIDQGEMPALATLIERGAMAKLKTIDPPLSPILWTSIATGKYGDDHGVLSFVEPNPSTGERRPVSSHSRKVKAIWNILHNQGLKTHVLGWWPSYPCEPINGVMVSNHFADFKREDTPQNWPLEDFHVHPVSRKKELEDLRIHPIDLTWSHIGPFVPHIEQKHLENKDYQELINHIPALVARCSTFHNVATEILENEEWDFLGVYLDSIDRASHEFMKFHAPKQDHIEQEAFDIFKDVMIGMYKYHDMMLDRIMHLIDDQTYVMLISDHGFYSDHRRLKELPKDSMAPAFEHSPYGIFCLSGPGIKKDEQLLDASLLDITPTLLQLFNLPIGEDMPGKVLTQAFEKEPKTELIPTYESLNDGDWGMLSEDSKDDVWAAQESLDQLIALGYVEPLTEDVEQQKKQMQFEYKYHTARIKYVKGEISNAILLFNDLLELTPRNGKIWIRLLNAHVALKQVDQAEITLKKMRDIFGNNNTPYIDVLEAKILVLRLQPKKAIEILNRLNQSGHQNAEFYALLGRTYLILSEWKKANESFAKAIELDANNANAFHGLSLTFLRLKKYEDAVVNGISAIGIKYAFPAAHYHLGEALIGIKEFEHAVNAFEVALQQEPGYSIARKKLIELYKNKLKNTDRVIYHQTILDTKMRPQMTIVSGLPRSGTSMMMQMLLAGGCDILTDNIRQSDDNNPKGYLEYEPVKSLLKDNTWLPEQNGKTIKVIMQLLGSLHPGCDYKIIFMERELDEVMMSQQKMLGKPAETFNTKLKDTFEQQKEKNRAWLEGQANMDVLYINYSDVVDNPQDQIERIEMFLEKTLDKEAMKKAVDKSLYRNKK